MSLLLILEMIAYVWLAGIVVFIGNIALAKMRRLEVPNAPMLILGSFLWPLMILAWVIYNSDKAVSKDRR